MIRQQKVSPNFEKSDWNMVGGLTILFSGFVAFWDWMHTHDEDISENPITPRRPIGLNSGGYSMFDTQHLTPVPSIPASRIQHLELTLLSGRF
jgi:hypothetical protein